MAKKSKVEMIDCSACVSVRKFDDGMRCKLRMKNEDDRSIYSKVTKAAECAWFKVKN